MPRRTRTRNLYSGHALLHTRDDREIAIGRQKIERPGDRRKRKSTFPEYTPGGEMGHRLFRAHRLGLPLFLSEDDKVIPSADGEVGSVYESEIFLDGRPTTVEISLKDLVLHAKPRRTRHADFEMVSRPRALIAMDEDDWEDAEDFELVERVAQAPRRGRGKHSYADVVVRKKRR